MKVVLLHLLPAALALGLVSCRDRAGTPPPGLLAQTNARTFEVTGVVQELAADGRTLVIRHQEISNYMPAMSMPFHARATNEVSGLKPGDAISFRLVVTADESWIDHVRPTGRLPAAEPGPGPAENPSNGPPIFRLTDIPDFALTNEFGQAVSLRAFPGRAVALTFFFTRCPLPEYCPRLTKNFQGALQKLAAAAGGPTNFHFLSISFDPLDTPLLLRAYARQYRYDSNHWSFITGHPDQIRELARGFGVPIAAEGAGYNHGFRTAIFDATGRLQTIWPVGGDMTDQIVAEITKGAQAH